MFKVGDKVVLKEDQKQGFWPDPQLFIIVRTYDGGIVDIEGTEQEIANDAGDGWYAHRFQLAEEAPKQPEQAITAGSWVEVIEDYRGAKVLRVGERYRVKSICRIRNIVRLANKEGGWAIRRFKLLANQAKAAAHQEKEQPFKAGDKVVLVKSERNDLEDFVGQVVTIKRLHPGPNKPTHLLIEEFDYDVVGNFMRVPEGHVPPPPPKWDGNEENLLTELIEKQNKKADGRVTPFAFVRRKPQFCVTPPCYAAINGGPGPLKAFVLSSLNMRNIYAENPEDARRYMNWLIKESPWADCFVTKDLEELWNKGAIMNCNKSLGQLVGAATVFRECTEHADQIPSFLWALDNGYDGNTAYLLCLNAKLLGKTWSKSSMSRGHSCMTSSLNSGDVFKFFAQGFHRPQEKPANSCTTTYRVYDSIGRQGGDDMCDWVSPKFRGKSEGAGWNASYSYTEANVYAFAKSIQQAIKDAE
jgi:hypothetical protein